jgi:hypothetical protein
MATILQESRFHQENQNETNIYHSGEMITLVAGFMMMVTAFGGIFDSNFLGLSLSLPHAFILGGAGALAVWSALFRDEDEKRAYYINLGLGLFFLANAIAGFLLPNALLHRTFINESLVRHVLPGFLELKMIDHIMHALFAVWFLLDAYLWKRRIDSKPA